jgi:hypothetical protein
MSTWWQLIFWTSLTCKYAHSACCRNENTGLYLVLLLVTGMTCLSFCRYFECNAWNSLGQAPCLHRLHEIWRSFFWLVSVYGNSSSEIGSLFFPVLSPVSVFDKLTQMLPLKQNPQVVWTRLVEIWWWEIVSMLALAILSLLTCILCTRCNIQINCWCDSSTPFYQIIGTFDMLLVKCLSYQGL